MATTSAEHGTATEAIRIETTTRAQAESLNDALAEFTPSLVRANDVWHVELRPGSDVTPLLLRLFEAIGAWLTENGLASCQVYFGERSFTLLPPSDARPTDSAEFLLERVIQLQTALESRVAIEQAKGLLVGRLGLPVEEAFAVLRRAARTSGRTLRELANEVVA